ncbi:CoA transferase, partial [Myxococcota bacterium]|nr:CoA transferase [Myxococcota bacterium]
GNRQTGYWHPMSVYPCRDGHIVLCAAGQSARDRLLSAMDRPELLLDPRFTDDVTLSQNKDDFDQEICSWLKQRTRQEIVDRLQSAGVAASAVRTPEEVVKDPHLNVQHDRHDGESNSNRRLPFRLRKARARDQDVRAMPTLGVSNTLRGARILEIGNIWAGPLAGRILSDLGADVVAVEPPWRRGGADVPRDLANTTHLFANNEIGDEPWNRIGSVNALMRGKRSLCVDLNHPQAMELLSQLIGEADVLIENFAPRSSLAEKLTRETLEALNPELVWVSITGHGTEGPDRAHLAFGPNIEARAGFTSQSGYPNTGPMRSGIAWPDPITALTAVAGTLTALRERQKNPQSGMRHVDVSMLESALWISNPSDAPTEARRQGARRSELAPQGIYPCQGVDRWIAISITSDQEWKSLCAVLDLDPSWPSLKLVERLSRHDAIDQAISERTEREDRRALAERLQAHGVMASWLSDARDLVSNQASSAEDFWIEVKEPDGDSHSTPGLPIRMDRPPVHLSDRAPRLGEDNRSVLEEWTRLTETEMEALERSGLVTNRPPP